MRLRPGFYNLLYRLRAAPWDAEVRPVLGELVESGRLTPRTHARVADLGCGTGAESVFLASRGFGPVTGVDFSAVAVTRARDRARAAGVADTCTFHQADLTASEVPALTGPYDLVCDFGALNDLPAPSRPQLAALIGRLTRPGGTVLLWAFQAERASLPAPARIAPMLAPGEEKQLFAELFDIEYLPTRPRSAMLLMTRKPA